MVDRYSFNSAGEDYVSPDGNYVAYEDYAELERQRDGLVAENAALKSEANKINAMDDILFFSCPRGAQEIMGQIVNAAIPATDAALREIGATAVEKFAKFFSEDDLLEAAAHFAQQLREGKV